MAAEAGLSLNGISGSGPNNRIVKADVEKAKSSAPSAAKAKAAPKTTAASSPAPQPAPGQNFTEIPLTNMRKVIAQRLQESKSTIPHYYLTSEITMDKIMKLREVFNEQYKGQHKISVNDFIIKASAMALRQVPEVNSSWSDQAIRRFNTVDISVAVATPNGLITPIVQNADLRGLASISSAVKELALKARENKLQPHEYQVIFCYAIVFVYF
jgi:pyruvate dehydrogenase E2 component (dihydrolipoamide acetyltransferase)